MFKKFFILTIFTLLLVPLVGQDPLSSYTFLKSEGKMPSDFKKYIESENREDMVLKRLFMSGLVVYGSELNVYIDKVADQLLKDYPELRKEMRFYILKSPAVNAFAFSDHIIFINLGLLAQIQNESELAFVISHELIHIVNKHVEIEKKEKKKKTKYDSKKDQFLVYHNRSREHEYESDREGFIKFFEKSGYSLEAVNGVFDVLQYGYLPFDEIKFDRQFVETNYYKFPDSYFLVNLTPIRSREDFIDTLSSHPNILKRRTIINELVEKSSSSNGSLFFQPESLFYEVRNIARFESINLYLATHDYANSFYNTYILLKEFPDNQFLNQALYFSLYGIAKHKNKESITELLGSYKDFEGEIQQVYHFFTKLNKDETALLALRYSWEFSKKYPQNEFVKNIIKDILKDLHTRKKLNYSDYSDYPMGIDVSTIQVDTIKVDTVNTTQTKSRFEKIKNNQNKSKVIPIERFKTQNFMLVHLRQDSLFMEAVENVLKQVEDKEILDVIDEGKFNEKLCNSVIVWAPKYYKISGDLVTVKNGVIENMINSSIKDQKIEAHKIFDYEIPELTTEKYNHYCQIQNFYYEYLYSNDIPMLFYQSNEIEDACIDFGGTCINFITAYREYADFTFERAFLFVPPMYIIYALAPEMFVHLLFKASYTSVHYALVDLKTGEKIVEKSAYIQGRNNTAAMNVFIYNMFNQYAPKKGNSK